MPELTWNGKDEAITEAEVETDCDFHDDEILDYSWSDDNLYIEGDNLNAMKVLNDNMRIYTNKGFVDLIYIDPPYNTGGADFVYNDRRKSDAWLCFMYPRLVLAKKLLKHDGVIFVSIDKNECDYLKVMMDEIFGRKNFLIPFIWRKKSGGGNDNKSGYTVHETILTYSGGGKIKKLRVSLAEKQMSSYGNWDSDPKGLYKLESLKLRRGPCQEEVERYADRRYKVTHPTDGREVLAVWSCSEEKMQEYWDEGLVLWTSSREYPCVKRYMDDRMKEGISPHSILEHPSLLTTSGRRDLEKLDLAAPPIHGHRRLYWDFPKPVNLIRYLLQMVDNDVTVLDFFAGSGTTAQAVLEANAEDAGTRNFVLVQIPEELPADAPARAIGCETLCDIGRTRIDRVIEKLTDEPKIFQLVTNGLEYHNLKLRYNNEKDGNNIS